MDDNNTQLMTTMSKTQRNELRAAALSYDLPLTALSRTLLAEGIERLHAGDEELNERVTQVADEFRARRAETGRKAMNKRWSKE